jgi:hypothetical protein
MDITMMPLTTIVVFENSEMALKKLFDMGLEPILGVYNPQSIHKYRGKESAR